jgi:hypothetical protein
MTIDPTLASASADQQQQQQQPPGPDLGAIGDVASVGIDIASATARGLPGASTSHESVGAASAVLEPVAVAAEAVDAGFSVLDAIGGLFEGLGSL